MARWKHRLGSLAWGTSLVALTCFVGPALFVDQLARMLGLTP
ncbi:MAG TPA: hypothetical protein VKA44_01370 [Gemmatimonadota bacterium]|nr:hypothetical protein [Gemmatimonadota bacterium]